MRKWIALFAVVLLVGCGTEPKNLSKTGGEKGKQKPLKCPGTMEPYHQVTVSLKNSVPVKIGLEVNGKPELDECHALKDEPPVVFGERDVKKLTFTVMHAGAYPQPPAAISFRLLDLGDCSGSGSLIMGANNLPLQFVTDYPNGTSCPARTFAALQVLQP